MVEIQFIRRAKVVYHSASLYEKSSLRLVDTFVSEPTLNNTVPSSFMVAADIIQVYEMRIVYSEKLYFSHPSFNIFQGFCDQEFLVFFHVKRCVINVAFATNDVGYI